MAMVDSDAIARARAVPIQSEIQRRGMKLPPAVRELVGPCPRCGGTDRFAIHLRKQLWNCRGCGKGGDVLDLVMHLDGVGLRDAVATLTRSPLERFHAQPAPLPPPTPKPVPAPFTDARQAVSLWESATPIAGTLAESYLRETRRLTLPPHVSPRVLRFHPRVWFSDKVNFGPAWHPCLVALYRGLVTDEPRAVMRTALTADGRKIGRAALGSVGGAAIKITDDSDVTIALTVGEGVETTLAGMMKGFAPAWALGSSGAIAKFPVLAGIEALTVLAETGDGGASARAVRECAARWLAAGREIFTVTSTIGGDLNDAPMAESIANA
jgi:hypothetical protein